MNIPFLQDTTFTGLISTKNHGTSQDWYNTVQALASAGNIQTLTYIPSSYNLSISNGNTVNLSSINSTFAANSGTYATTSYVNSNFFPLSGGTITGDLTITNNLYVQGSTTYIDTNVVVTSAMYIDTNSSETALRITQRGSGDVIRVEDDAHPDQTPFIVTSAGNVGIGTANPNSVLTVVGNISATGNIYNQSGLQDYIGNNNFNNLFISENEILFRQLVTREIRENQLNLNQPHGALTVNNKLYIVGTNKLVIYNNPSNNLTDKTEINIPGGGYIGYMAFNDALSCIYVPTENLGVYKLDITNNNFTLFSPVTVPPGAAIGFWNNYIYLGDDNGTLRKLDTNGNLVTTIDFNDSFLIPHAIEPTPDNNKLIISVISFDTPIETGIITLSSDNNFNYYPFLYNDFITDDIVVTDRYVYFGLEGFDSAAPYTAGYFDLDTLTYTGIGKETTCYFTAADEAKENIYFGSIQGKIIKYTPALNTKRIYLTNKVGLTGSYNELISVNNKWYTTNYASSSTSFLREITFEESLVTQSPSDLILDKYQTLPTVFNVTLTGSYNTPIPRPPNQNMYGTRTQQVLDHSSLYGWFNIQPSTSSIFINLNTFFNTNSATIPGQTVVIQNTSQTNNLFVYSTATNFLTSVIRSGEIQRWVYAPYSLNEKLWIQETDPDVIGALSKTAYQNASGNWETAYASTTALDLSAGLWNDAYNTGTVYQANSASYATNTTLNSVSSLLTPLSLTNTLTSQLTLSSDPRLSDARTPTPHTHTAADIDSESADAGYVLTADGDGGASWEAATGGSPSSYEIKTESFTASVGGRYACDTSAGEVVPAQTGQLEFYGLRVFNSDQESSPSVYISVAEQAQDFYIENDYTLELYVNQDETTYDTIIEFINENGGDYGLSAELVDGYDGSDLLPPDESIEDDIPLATPESFAYDLFEVTLPESPNSGDSFTLADASGTWANNAPEIVGAEDVDGNPPPINLDINGIANLVYVDGAGWKTLDSTRGSVGPKPAFSREPATGSTSGLVTWGGGFDTTGGFANNVFVVPAGLGGLYMFNAAIFYNQPADTQMELGIYVNGIRVRAFYTKPFDGVQGQAQVFGVVDLNVGDTVDVRVNFFGDPGAYVRNDVGVSWFTGVKL
jgi:hypothetical protein